MQHAKAWAAVQRRVMPQQACLLRVVDDRRIGKRALDSTVGMPVQSRGECSQPGMLLLPLLQVGA